MISRGFSFPVVAGTASVTPIRIPGQWLIGIQISGWIIAALAAVRAYLVLQARSDYSAAKFDYVNYGSLILGCAAGGNDSATTYIPIPGGVWLDGDLTVQATCIGAGGDSDFYLILQLAS